MSSMDFTLQGTGPNSNVELQIDPSFNASRTSIRPTEYNTPNGAPGGYYGVTLFSGTIAASLGAASELASIRWMETNKLMLLLKLEAALGVYTAGQTVANPLELDIIKAAAFTTDYTTNNTKSVVGKGSNKMRSDKMVDSLFNGINNSSLNICTTTGMTGSVKTLDSFPFGGAVFPGNALGVADTKILYQWDPTLHPQVLNQGEGIIVRNVGAFGAAATYKLMVKMFFAELQAF